MTDTRQPQPRHSPANTSERRRAALLLTRDLPVAGSRLGGMLLDEHSARVRYAVALAATAVAALGTLAVTPYIGRVMFVLFWPAVLVASFVGGLGPAIVASVLSVVLVHAMTARIGDAPIAADVVPLIVFLAASVGISMLAQALRVARLRSAEATGELHQLSLELEEQATELEQQLEESQALQEEVEQANAELADQTADAERAAAFSRGILASISEPFVVHDADWRFVYINEQARRTFRESPRAPDGDLVGVNLWDAYPDIVGTEHERQMRHAAEHRVPVTYEAYYAGAGTWSVMSCYPLPDGGLATQWRDVTARRRAEEAASYLARASKVLGASLDYDVTLRDLAYVVVPELAEWCTVHLLEEDGQLRRVAIAHVDPDKVRWADALESRYPARHDAPNGIPKVVRTGEAELLRDIPDELLVAGAVDDEHLGILRALGLRSAMIVPLVSHGKIRGGLSLVSGPQGRRYDESDLELAQELARRAALAVDNALLHRAERRARVLADEANTVKLQFLAVMSHELRTPLNAIGGYAELMRLGLRGPVTEAQLQDIERIMVSQRNLLGIINDILNFAKIDAGHLEFHLTDVPLGRLLEEVQDVVAPQLGAGGLALDGPECDTAITVRGDREKIRQILLNLLSNAIKFTPAGGRIAIKCTPAAGLARIEVRDTGVGIAPDRLEAVFDPFVQLDRTLTSRHEGTGLGLAISRDLARAMKGDIIASSEPGNGSIFTVTLPLAGV